MKQDFISSFPSGESGLISYQSKSITTVSLPGDVISVAWRLFVITGYKVVDTLAIVAAACNKEIQKYCLEAG
jgi:hypothetical protein